MKSPEFGHWEGGGDGDTATAHSTRWGIEGGHDSMEEALLKKIDAERGGYLNVVTRRFGEGRERRLLGFTIELDNVDEQVHKGLDAYVEHLVQVMITAPDDGARSATQAYVIAKGLQTKLKKTSDASYSMSLEAARSFTSELLNDASPDFAKDALEELVQKINHAVRERRKEKGEGSAARSVRGGSPSVRERRRFSGAS